MRYPGDYLVSTTEQTIDRRQTSSMTSNSSDNEQTTDNQKGKADWTADTKWTFDALSQCEPANTPHEPAVISLMREYIEEANTAMLSNDYRKAATFVRLAHYNEQCFTVNEDGEIKVKASKWETWRPKY